MRLKPSSLAWLGVLFLFTLPAVWPIITPGYFPIHDDTQVVRVAQMTQALLDGQLPVRWVKDLGYGFGYPIFNFYNPLPYYIGSLFHLIGFSALSATKIMFVFPVFVGALGMFMLMRKHVDNRAALVASVIYTYAPYHAVQIYVRGAVAEYWAVAILPFVIYYLIAKKPLGAGISLALLILAHNLTALMAVTVVTILFVIQLATDKKWTRVWSVYFLTLCISLGLAAFFWLPAIFEKNFTNVDSMIQQEFSTVEHFVSPWQLWSSPWGFGGSSPDEHDGLSFIVGKAPILLTIISLLFFAHIKAQRRQLPLYVAALFILGLSLYMLVPPSRFVWERLNVLDVLQFPWRFLSLVNLSTAILSGITIAALTPVIRAWQSTLGVSPEMNARQNELRKARPEDTTGVSPWWFIKKHLPGSITLSILIISGTVLFIVFSSLRYFQPQFKFPATDQELLGETKIKLEVSGLSDEYMPTGAQRPASEVDLPPRRFAVDLTEEEQATVVLDKTQVLSLSMRLSQPKPMVINIHAFPGWVGKIDNQTVPLETYGPYKLMKIEVPTGEHRLTVRFEDSPIRKIANSLSLLTIATLIVVTFPYRYKKTKKTTSPLLQ